MDHTLSLRTSPLSSLTSLRGWRCLCPQCRHVEASSATTKCPRCGNAVILVDRAASGPESAHGALQHPGLACSAACGWNVDHLTCSDCGTRIAGADLGAPTGLKPATRTIWGLLLIVVVALAWRQYFIVTQ